jgi:hypothetical protein
MISDQKVIEDYWGFSESHQWFFPDGVQYLEYQVMNEGAKKKYQSKSNRDVVLERHSGNARLRMDTGEERHALLVEATTGWKLFQNGQEVQFSSGKFKQWLDLANPRLVEDYEKVVRKANPWLMADMTIEDIDREIESLEEMKAEILKREEGKESSSDR